MVGEKGGWGDQSGGRVMTIETMTEKERIRKEKVTVRGLDRTEKFVNKETARLR